jgi:phosphoribosylformylglycinamidine cyclo-ligase
MDPLTYRHAGVNIDAGDEAVRRIAPLARSTLRPEVIGGIGGFAGFVRVPAGYREPVLVSSTDGVGTKLKVAIMVDRHDTVGIDLVAMGVNDLIVHGASPLYFLDYIGLAQLDPRRVERIVAGVAEGCRQAGCALIGGETAELPDLYREGEYDLAGFAVGVVEREAIIDGSAVRVGDRILGLASTGLHSNGYSLARRIVFDMLRLKPWDHWPAVGRPVAETLLEPSRIYVSAVLGLLPAARVHAMAHVTGGGITGNLPRVLPPECRAVIRRGAWTVPSVFIALQQAGRIADEEMFRTFNMGLGYLIVLPEGDVGAAVAALTAAGEQVHDVGEIIRGPRGVDLV